MYKKKMLLIIVSTFIIPFLLFGQIREEAERIHELFLHGSINETDEVLLHLIIKETHTITGSIIGSGATKRLSAVRWGVTINLLWAWLLTIPVSALIAMLFYYLLTAFGVNA